jgi:hypothetical protein
LRRNLEKEAFWTFLEHKSEENDKVSKLCWKLPLTASGLSLDGVMAWQEKVDVKFTHDKPVKIACEF